MPSQSALLTVPDPLENIEEFLVTGNEYVSLPKISPQNGAILGLNVLSMKARGLVEFRGKPLISPRLELAEPMRLQNVAWTRLADWVLQFEWKGSGIVLGGKIYAPPGERGFVYSLDIENGERPRTIRVGLDVLWQETVLTIFSTRRMTDARYAAWDQWTKSFVCESTGAQGEAAFAVGADVETENQIAETGSATMTRTLSLEAGERAGVSFFIAVGSERDAARTTVVHMRRRGAKDLLDSTRAWLSSHRPSGCESGAAATQRALYNLYFAYFYSLGMTIDSEDLVLLTSRSSLYYVSAATWPRDALYWSLPGILALDREKARQVLLTAFRRHLKHPGEHAQYIDGGLLYPGFELDQLCAFPIALYRYWTSTGDRSLLLEPDIKAGLDKVIDVMVSHKAPGVSLFKTFLLSTDDPALLPYVTYANALASVALVMTGEMRKVTSLKALGRQVRDAIYEKCTIATVNGKMFAGAVDLEGKHHVFDEPPGSLVILPAYGFCSTEDPIYRCTVEWINSERNPNYVTSEGVPMPGCMHAPYAWPMSLVNQILANPKSERAQVAKRALTKLPLDGNLACESVDANTGVVKTGRMMASFAGWLGYALLEAEKPRSKRRFVFPPDHKMRKAQRAKRS